jgi:hypothetical protein
MLKSPKHSRAPMLDFKDDWALLQHAGRRNSLSAEGGTAPAAGEPTATIPGAASY